MIEDVEGPSPADIVAAAKRLNEEARKRGGRVRFKRGDTLEEEKEWLLMNDAAEELERQGVGRFDGRSFEHFEFVLTRWQ